MTVGITGWGAYIPVRRLGRAAIAAVTGAPVGRGARSVACYDEDATAMAVAALRTAVSGADAASVDCLLLATTALPYVDKTNATAVHAAVGLTPGCPAYDLAGSVRSGIGAFLAAHDRAANGGRPAVVLSDLRTGLPGGADEVDGGDGAAAFRFGPEPVAVVTGVGHATEEFLDRWRVPGDVTGRRWEERFGEQTYLSLGHTAAAEALDTAGVAIAEADHVVIGGPHTRSLRRMAAALGVGAPRYIDLAPAIGNTGTAHLGIGLCAALDRAAPGQTIVLILLADGADAIVLRTTEALADAQVRHGADESPTVAEQIASGSGDLDYFTYLRWRGLLRTESQRRPLPEPPAGPPALRAERWKYGFVGSRCRSCGAVHLPPARVCVYCRAVDAMRPEPMADAVATVRNFTIDRLAYSPSPPVVGAVLDFDGGGRFACELTDVDAADVHVGMRVRMTFRRLYTTDGIHNYFWKARPERLATDRHRAEGVG